MHDCGYCHSQGSSKSHGAWAYSLGPHMYQKLIDHGWRRAGQYLYKPCQDTCCFTYTIRLNAQLFQVSKGQKKSIRKLRKYIQDDVGKKAMMDMDEDECPLPAVSDKNAPGHGKSMPDSFQMAIDPSVHEAVIDVKNISPFHQLIMDAEKAAEAKHAFKVELKPAAFDQDTFDLYCKYQAAVHKDKPESLSVEGFTRFLINSPIKLSGQSDTFPGYGSFHQKYYCDGKLIAVGGAF